MKWGKSFEPVTPGIIACSRNVLMCNVVFLNDTG